MKKIITLANQRISKLLIITLSNLLIITSVFAQAPEKMSYQAVIRNSGDVLVANTQIGMEINIRKGSAAGTIVYTETQTPTTNANGLVSIEIGGEAGFSSINWTSDTYFIETRIAVVAPLTTYTITGTSQLLSVPYALHSKTAHAITGSIVETQNLNDVLTRNNSAGYKNIINLANPVNAKDAATKDYVDNLINISILDFKAELGVTDNRDGTHYKAVRIGNQVWMAENLKYLPSVVGPASGSPVIPHYYVYGYNGTVVADAKATSNYATYGVLYNWPAAMAGSSPSSDNPSGVQGICPEGWHLPSHYEWWQLQDYLIENGYNYDGTYTGNKIAKSLATSTGWTISTYTGAVGNTDYPAKRNASGFSALPGGARHTDNFFTSLGGYTGWWSTGRNDMSGTYYQWTIEHISIALGKIDFSAAWGLSVRCVKD